MKISVYTSLFNYSPEKFDLVDAFKNWSKYAKEIVVATLPDQNEQIGKVIQETICSSELSRIPFYVKLVECSNTSLEDPLFDGKLKNHALQNCSNDIVIQQDLDERIGGSVEQWISVSEAILSFPTTVGCFIPVIDLYKDYNHYKSIGAKWYIHKRDGSYRGPVSFAKRDNGTIDTDKSDTCELIDYKGDLLPSIANLKFKDEFDITNPHIIHLGYLDLNKRIENNKFWGPIWSARNGKKVEVPIDLESLEEDNQATPHGLKERWWEC